MRPGVNEDTSATLGAIRDRKTVYPRRITLEVAWERVGRIRRGDAAVRRSQFDRGNGHLPFVCSERSGSCVAVASTKHLHARWVAHTLGQYCNSRASISTH